jgi:hypothetical protein
LTLPQALLIVPFADTNSMAWWLLRLLQTNALAPLLLHQKCFDDESRPMHGAAGAYLLESQQQDEVVALA